jgi:hypothetical protein
VVEIEGGHVTESHPKIRREGKFREVRPPKRRGDQKEASESGLGFGLREVFQKNRSSERMTHENGLSSTGYKFGNAARPDPILGVGWPRHARRLDEIARSQGLPEQRFPVHFASPPPRLTNSVNDEDGSPHRRKVIRPARASKMAGVAPSNDLQISCKRPVKPTFLIASRRAETHRSPGQAAFVGCICGLGRWPARSRLMSPVASLSPKSQ